MYKSFGFSSGFNTVSTQSNFWTGTETGVVPQSSTKAKELLFRIMVYLFCFIAIVVWWLLKDNLHPYYCEEGVVTMFLQPILYISRPLLRWLSLVHLCDESRIWSRCQVTHQERVFQLAGENTCSLGSEAVASGIAFVSDLAEFCNWNVKQREPHTMLLFCKNVFLEEFCYNLRVQNFKLEMH